MHRIAICEDEMIYSEKLLDYLKVYKSQYELETEVFTGGTELINSYKNGKRYDLIFLDIILNEENGISIAKEIREIDRKVLIIITTSLIEYAVEGYEIDAVAFLLKPIDEMKLKQTFIKSMDRIENKKGNHYVLCRNGRESVIDLDRVEYIESFGRKICFHLENRETEEFYESISIIESELSKKWFIRSHRSYLVNLSKVKQIQNREITMKSGRSIVVSKSKYRECYGAFTKYLLGDNR